MIASLHTLSPRDLADQQLVAPFFLGIIVNFFLWGIQVTQSYYYYKSYRKTDSTWVKATVALLFTIDMIHSICASQVAWRFLVQGWGDPAGISQSPGWGLNTISITDAITASLVHLFYAHKLWSLFTPPYNYIWPTVVILGSLTQLIAGIGMGIFMFIIQITFAGFGRIKVWACLWLVGASITDVVITVLMSWRLQQSRTGFRRTDDIISKLIRITVETGLATAIVQFMDIVVYLIWTTKTYHMVLGFTGPKVYSNSMLALLNSRSTGANSSKGGDSIQIHTSQSVSVSNDYELRTRGFKPGIEPLPSHMMRSDSLEHPDASVMDVKAYTPRSRGF